MFHYLTNAISFYYANGMKIAALALGIMTYIPILSQLLLINVHKQAHHALFKLVIPSHQL